MQSLGVLRIKRKIGRWKKLNMFKRWNTSMKSKPVEIAQRQQDPWISNNYWQRVVVPTLKTITCSSDWETRSILLMKELHTRCKKPTWWVSNTAKPQDRHLVTVHIATIIWQLPIAISIKLKSKEKDKLFCSKFVRPRNDRREWKLRRLDDYKMRPKG